MNSKINRINHSLIEEISYILKTDVKNQDIKFVTITAARTTSDLRYAKIYFTCVLDIDKKDIECELEEASGYIRRELAERIDIRHTPKLVFKFDESVEYGNHIDNIIEKIHDKENV